MYPLARVLVEKFGKELVLFKESSYNTHFKMEARCGSIVSKSVACGGLTLIWFPRRVDKLADGQLVCTSRRHPT